MTFWGIAGCLKRNPSGKDTHPKPPTLTLDHDHVDVDGADRRLRESLSFLQDLCDFTGRNSVVRLRPERHQLPNGHASRDNRTLEGQHVLKARSAYNMPSKRASEANRGLLTITPDVTLMRVCPMKDGFKSHPFYRHLNRKETRRVKSEVVSHEFITLSIELLWIPPEHLAYK